MKDGTFFVFNNSQYHSVENNSSTARIHIIIHGPIRFSPDTVLELAQKQNGLHTRKALLNQVVKKFSLLGCDIFPGSKTHVDWLAAGHDRGLALPEVALAIVADKISEPDLLYEAVNNFTVASVFPEKPPVILVTEIDRWLISQYATGAQFAALVGCGTFLLSANLFILELFKAVNLMRSSKAILAGHLMHQNTDELPFMHEQFLILDLRIWKKLGCPSLSEPYAGEISEFCSHYRSAENIHDKYTPLWLSAVAPKNKTSLHIKLKAGREGWCTRLMSRALSEGHEIINVPQGLRHTKKFSYPRAGQGWQYFEIKKEIKKLLDFETNNVYVVNNEPLQVSLPEDFFPDQLISVSAGLKPAALLHQFWKISTPKEINILDFSKPALDYMQELILCSDEQRIKLVMIKWFGRTKSAPIARELAEDYFQLALTEGFEGDVKFLLDAFTKLRKARFFHADMINNPASVFTLLKPGLKPYFWHSNAFSSNASLYLKSSEQLRGSYQKLALGAAEALKQPAWLINNPDAFEAQFGDEIVAGVFSAGYGPGGFSRSGFSKIVSVQNNS